MRPWPPPRSEAARSARIPGAHQHPAEQAPQRSLLSATQLELDDFPSRQRGGRRSRRTLVRKWRG